MSKWPLLKAIWRDVHSWNSLIGNAVSQKGTRWSLFCGYQFVIFHHHWPVMTKLLEKILCFCNQSWPNGTLFYKLIVDIFVHCGLVEIGVQQRNPWSRMNSNHATVCVGFYGGKTKSKRYVLWWFLEVAIEMPKRMDSERLFQMKAVQDWNVLVTTLVLTLEQTEWSLCLIPANGTRVMWQAWSEVKKAFSWTVYQISKTDFELNSKFYCQPMKGM